MKIIVVIKRVPDTETQVRVGPDEKSIDPTGVVYVMNPYDEYAGEEAVRLKEKYGGDITILCVGTKAATKEIRTTTAMGCDSGVLMKRAASYARFPLMKSFFMKPSGLFCILLYSGGFIQAKQTLHKTYGMCNGDSLFPLQVHLR